jgi:hypothetical protein
VGHQHRANGPFGGPGRVLQQKGGRVPLDQELARDSVVREGVDVGIPFVGPPLPDVAIGIDVERGRLV